MAEKTDKQAGADEDLEKGTRRVLAMAVAAHQSGQPARAAELCKNALRRQPDNADALHLLGLIAHSEKRSDEALAWIARALAISPSNTNYRNSQGAVLLDLGRVEEAESAFLEAAEGDPPHDGARRNLATARLALGRLEDAESVLEGLVADHPDEADLVFRHAVVLQRLNRLPRAAAAYRRVLTLAPGRASAHANLAATLAALGDNRPADAHFRRALELGDNSAATLTNWATLHQSEGRLEEAAAAFKEALKLDPSNSGAFIPLSAILRSRGEGAEARRILHAGIRRQPVRTFPCTSQPKATVLTLRGLNHSSYGLSAAGATMISGGNFSTSDFVAAARFTNHIYHILEGNLTSDAGTIPPHDVILNTIGDADLERAALTTAAAYCVGHTSIPVINAPETVLKTTRDGVYAGLDTLPGLVVPRVVRLGPTAGPAALAVDGFWSRHELEPPVLARRTGTQTGVSLAKIDSAAALAAYLNDNIGSEVYVAEFVDTRDDAGIFRKMRVFFIDGEIYPVQCFFSDQWNVHADCRATFMRDNAASRAEERAFLTAPATYLGEAAYRALRSIARRLRLDFFGVDFGLDREGRVVIYEANAIMRHNLDYIATFPYLEGPLRAISLAFDDMIEARAARP